MAPPPPQRWDNARVAVAIILGLWIAWAAVAAWSAPQHARANQLGAAVAAHRITGHQMAARPPSLLPVLVSRTGDDYYNSDDDVVVWTEQGGRQYWIAPGEMSELGVRSWYPPGVDESAVPFDRAARDGAARWMQQHAGPQHGDAPRADVVRQVGWFGAALTLLLLVRPPATGTRWFWFWVMGIPFALGLVWFCWAEVLGHGTPRERRRSGWWGLAVSFVANSALMTLVNLRG